MKNIKYSILLLTSFLFIFSSCKKEGTTITRVINVELKANENYSYEIPAASGKDDELQITQQAGHFSVSRLAAISGKSNMKFEYTPTLDFTGNDEVLVSTVESNQHGHSGHCSGGHHDDVTVYDFKIVVKSNVK